MDLAGDGTNNAQVLVMDDEDFATTGAAVQVMGRATNTRVTEHELDATVERIGVVAPR